jgi:hypothetical protein
MKRKMASHIYIEEESASNIKETTRAVDVFPHFRCCSLCWLLAVSFDSPSFFLLHSFFFIFFIFFFFIISSRASGGMWMRRRREATSAVTIC